MASNEHKNLSESNLHNPKGFSLASNDTICSKTYGGALAWEYKYNIKIDKPTQSGYSTLLENYQYPDAYDTHNKSPYLLSVDYGATAIAPATTVLQKKFFKIGECVVDQDGRINNGVLQITGDDTWPFTVALVKFTPTSVATSVYPVVLFEKSCTAIDENTVISYTLDPLVDFTNIAVTAGDHIFLMVKANHADGVGQEVWFSTTIELGYN